MNVLTSMRDEFRQRVLDDYKISKGYLKINNRQKFCSVEVLKFLLLHGVDMVRRREIRSEFIGDREDWKRPAIRLNGRLVKPALPLSDSELQHILNKLILDGFVIKVMVCPDSKRTKNRQKMDSYYRVSLLHLKDEDWLEGEVLIAYREIMSPKVVDCISTAIFEPVTRRGVARTELKRMRIANTSDRDLDTWLNSLVASP
jgi:hypothetical protein